MPQFYTKNFIQRNYRPLRRLLIINKYMLHDLKTFTSIEVLCNYDDIHIAYYSKLKKICLHISKSTIGLYQYLRTRTVFTCLQVWLIYFRRLDLMAVVLLTPVWKTTAKNYSVRIDYRIRNRQLCRLKA